MILHLFLLLYACVWAHQMCHPVCVEVRGQIAGTGPILYPVGLWMEHGFSERVASSSSLTAEPVHPLNTLVFKK